MNVILLAFKEQEYTQWCVQMVCCALLFLLCYTCSRIAVSDLLVFLCYTVLTLDMLTPVSMKKLWNMTSSNGNIFRVTGHLCGEFTGPPWIPHTKASDAELWCYFDLRPNKRLGKQSRGWWFETLSPPLWRHRNEIWVSSNCTKPQHRIFIWTLFCPPVKNQRSLCCQISISGA